MTQSTIQSPPGQCSYCGMYHVGTCPRVKAIEYHSDGSIKRVEFHDPTSPQPLILTGEGILTRQQRSGDEP